jgi:predicted pyridoxal phosphate-dependent acyltransferase
MDTTSSGELTSQLNCLLREHLESLRERNLYRHLRTVQGEQDPWVELDGRRVLNLCSNNYLGLASHPRLKEAAAQAAYTYGCGSGASRLICGTMALHETLEHRIAKFKGADAALVYNSGYMANLGVIPPLVGKQDVVFSDELNHASVIDGCRLSRAMVRVFPHGDVDALERQLRELVADGKEGRRLIVVDGVFSMDGDIAPLPGIVEVARRYEAMLMVDEAHATGVLGPGGRGTVAHFGLEGHVPIVMGTLSKALGCLGAYVVGSQELREYLINTSRSFIFTTALPPPVLASAIAALDILEEQPSLVTTLQRNADYLRQGLEKLGYDTLTSQTQIMPVVIGDAARTCEMSGLLLQEGVLATAIRPPTVPEGTSRIRVSVIATHTWDDLDFALAAFEKAGRSLGIV